jgi:hypothetical protein
MYSENRNIIFFNFEFKPEYLSLDLNHLHTYQAWGDKKMTKLFTSSNSLNSLADRLGLSVGTIRNNLNWEKGIKITDKESGKKTTVYLTEKGASIRTKALTSQLAPSPQRGEGATAPPKRGASLLRICILRLNLLIERFTI